EALNEQLERSNEELDAFSYTVSHDLKEPLRGIGQYVEFLREDHADAVGPAGREKLEALGWLSQRMSDLLDGLFELSRVGRVDLAREEISLQELVDDVLRTLVGRLRENGTEVRIPRPLPTVWCDRVRVRQVFANLISNASKYNDKVERWVEVGFQEGSRPTIYYVRDNGIGIPERFHKAVFDMFRRLHPHDRYGGGTGAGLAIARRVVERHGGRLWLESKAGVGTTFFFTLGA
ncbi:MAG TPA: ATP-binding protein, partial [Myxococcaceae bacterium]|nr:ATP-binding protein [Myxococcaceae bacterium]